jgi:hypothetical protein
MILVEGENDQHFLYNLCQKVNFNPVFKVEKVGSLEKAIYRFATDLKGNRQQPLGLIVDADMNLEKRQSENIKEVGKYYTIQKKDFTKTGLIIQPALEQKFGVWIWPDNEKNGILEDLYLQLVQDGDLLLGEAKRVVGNLPNIEPIRFRPQHISKAIVHSWLAWQDNPGAPIGASLQRSNIDLSKPIIQNFKNWLKNLYTND